MSDLIFEASRPGRFAKSQWHLEKETCDDIPVSYLRQDIPMIPQVSNYKLCVILLIFLKEIFQLIHNFILWDRVR